MHDDNEKMSSIEQDGWKDLNQAVRVKLSEKVAEISDMTPEQVHKFAEAVQIIQWTEFQAQIWDERMQRAKAPFSSYD